MSLRAYWPPTARWWLIGSIAFAVIVAIEGPVVFFSILALGALPPARFWGAVLAVPVVISIGIATAFEQPLPASTRPESDPIPTWRVLLPLVIAASPFIALAIWFHSIAK